MMAGRTQLAAIVQKALRYRPGKRLILAVLVALVASGFTLASPTSAQAATYACPSFSSWESGPGGAWVNARIEFRASDLCNGHHVAWAVVRIWRTCWPPFDSGRRAVFASGPNSTKLNWIQLGAGDSILPGCTTHTGYDYGYY